VAGADLTRAASHRERKGGSKGEKWGVTKVLVFLVSTKHD